MASSNPPPQPDFHLTQCLPSCLSLLRINEYVAWDDFASAKKCHSLIGQEISINVMFHLLQLPTPVSNLLHNSSSITHHNSSPWEVNGAGSNRLGAGRIYERQAESSESLMYGCALYGMEPKYKGKSTSKRPHLKCFRAEVKETANRSLKGAASIQHHRER